VRSWQEDQVHALSTINNEHRLFEMLVLLARDLGFDHCAYGLRMPLPLSGPRVVMFNNYPARWQLRYQQENYLAVDPTVRHGMRSLLPIVWSDEVFASARDFWEDARSFGLQIGWAQSSRDQNGVGGMLTLARSGEPLTKAEVADKVLRMAWLTQVAHLGMSRCLLTRLMPEAGEELTEREVEVLRWTADGKTSGQIADILQISERTVNFHVANAMAKLNAANKTAAVVRATVLGLLY
jgi:LuxR family transcriptional regulator